MAVLKSYSCAKCGGVLVFDSDQKFFDCPFCGTKFDVMDFHGDEVLSQAKDCLKKKTFDVAKSKYNSVLEKEPENFEALLGSVLCELHITSVEELNNREILAGTDLTAAKKALNNARVNTPKKEAVYFNKILEILSINEDLNRLENEKKELSSEDTRNQIDRKMYQKHMAEQYREEAERSWIWPMIIGFAIIAILLIGVGLDAVEPVVYISFGIGILALIAYFIWKSIRKKEEKKSFTPAAYMTNAYNSKISVNDSAYNKACRDLITMYPVSQRIRKIQHEEDIAKETSKNPDTNIDPEGMIICSKCAARLELDKDKRVYQCNHCGVAYGVSLFFGLPMEKALDSMNNGHFTDAEQRFESILMIHPSDFDARLGIILCKGKWTKVSDIDLADDVSAAKENGVRNCIGEALQHTSVENRPYFENLGKLISLFEEYSNNKTILDDIKKEIETFDARAEVYSVAFDSKYDKQSRAEERTELVRKTYPYQAKNKKIEEEFLKLRKSVLEMRNDSVLAK